jgi:glycosyltransferase involved in cell wall biosynthesis
VSRDAKPFVCAFRGRRDSYQVPLALAENELLDQFITDAYALSWMRQLAKFFPQKIRVKLDSRSDPGIPIERVRCLWGTTLVEHLRHRAGCERMVTFDKLDRRFSWAAARRAAQTRSHLFLYSSYAWEAFTAIYSHTPRKVLFQYHPHPGLEKRILAEDGRAHPYGDDSILGGTSGQLTGQLIQRERDCWKYADLILCASTFTKHSLIEAGADGKKCFVIPYGIEPPVAIEAGLPTDAFQVVFVGSGIQRKGLHHLLLAWRKAVLPGSSRLTLVCRMIDSGIRQLAGSIPRVILCQGVSHAELNRIYATSSLFAMPSLIEGFGQVYLEAMAQGCPVLGTSNTCLPDLGGESDGIFLVTPGSVDELVHRLEQLSKVLPGNGIVRQGARDCAGRFSWGRFRRDLCDRLRDA